jgi:hypothetical protein
VVSFKPRPLYSQGKSPWYPLDRRLSGSQSRSGRGGEEKNSQLPPGIEPYNTDRPVRSPALYRLSYHGSPVEVIPQGITVTIIHDHFLAITQKIVLKHMDRDGHSTNDSDTHSGGTWFEYWPSPCDQMPD